MSIIKQSFHFLLSIWHRKEKDSDLSFFLAAGPLSVFCSAIVGLQKNVNIDLVFIAMLGMILCIRNRMRGLIYSLLVLAFCSLLKHAFFIDSHLWQLGIEISVAIGFAMTAVAVDLINKKEIFLLDRLTRQENTIHNLEDDLVKARQDAQTEQIVLNDRLTAIQKELDDNVSECSSFQILNDVLRKTSAETNREKETIAEKYIEKERQVVNIQCVVGQLHCESDRLKETIVEREFDLNRLQEEMHELTSKQNEISLILSIRENDLLLATQAKEGAEVKLQQMQKALDEQVTQFNQQEKDHWMQQVSERDQTITVLEERLQSMSQKESLYQQLKKQFDEKNHVLHQSRVQLFHTETALQAIKIEQDRQHQLQPSIEEDKLVKDLTVLEEERFSLEKENDELVQIIHRLVNSASENEPNTIIERLSKIKSKKAKSAEKKKKKKEPVVSS